MVDSWLSKKHTLYIKNFKKAEAVAYKGPIATNLIRLHYQFIFLHINASPVKDSLIRIAYRQSFCSARLVGLQLLAALSVLVQEMQKLPIKWVRLDKFCQVTGFTPKSVYALVRNGRWMISKHFIKRGRRLYINIVEYERWVERG